MSNDRKGKFFFEKMGRYITLESQGGTFDQTLSSDCRSGDDDAHDIKPWTAISMIEGGWGDDVLNPWGLPDGDYPNPDKIRRTEDGTMVDKFGRPIFIIDDEEDDDLGLEELLEERMENDLDSIRAYDEKDVEDHYDYYYHSFEDIPQNFPEETWEQDVSDFMEDADQGIHEVVEENDLLDPHEHLLRRGSRASLIFGKIRGSRKEERMCSTHGSFSNGKRGNDFYELTRRNRNRVTRHTHEKIASGINDVFAHKLLPGQKQRVAIIGAMRRCKP